MADRRNGSRSRTALVTGASSGIGRELARIHARKGGDLVVVARRAEELNTLKAELETAHGIRVTVIARDLSAPGAAQAVFDATEAAGLTIDVLINNAGFGGHGLFHERALESHSAMIQVNVTALTELTRLYLPGMVARRHGRVLNLGSMAGFLPGPLQAVYYATKAYVLSLTEALANELQDTGVTATVLCPGPTASGFESAGELQGVSAFKNAASARGGGVRLCRDGAGRCHRHSRRGQPDRGRPAAAAAAARAGDPDFARHDGKAGLKSRTMMGSHAEAPVPRFRP